MINDIHLNSAVLACAGAGLLLVALVVIQLLRWSGQPQKKAELMICPNCGNFGHPQVVRPGSDAMTIVLLVLFILPGIFYALWRQMNQRLECPTCHHAGMVPHNSPRGLQLQSQFHATK